MTRHDLRKSRFDVRLSRSASGVSLARALSKLGICSRKQAESRVRAGRVSIRGRLVVDPTHRIDLNRDQIEMDGKAIRAPRERVVIALHKPAGVVTTRVDPRGRPTVYGLLSGLDTWVFPVGRLDCDSSGLLILTNDHQLGESLTNPEQGTAKTYHVRVKGVPSCEALQWLRTGMTLRDGAQTRPAQTRIIGIARTGQAWLEMTLREGKNRQIRRMCAAVGHDVVELVRVRIGDLSLGRLETGRWRRLTRAEIARLNLRHGEGQHRPLRPRHGEHDSRCARVAAGDGR